MRRKYWILPIAFCLLIAICGVPIYSFLLRRQAEDLIRNASTLCKLQGNAPTIKTVQALYKGKLRQMDGCTASECGYETVVSNRLLANLHWAPYSELRSGVWFSNGILVSTFLDFTSSANEHHSVVSHVFIQGSDGPEARNLEFDLDPWEENAPADTNGIVDVSPESFRVHESTVLGFDTRCLIKHRGCLTVAELLPTVWERAKDGSIRCRLPNHEGFIESPW